MKTIAKIGFVLAVSMLASPSFSQEPPAKISKEKQSLPANGRKTQKKTTVAKRSVPAKKMEAKSAQPTR